MIILVGGVHMSGRDYLASVLAERLGYHHFQINKLPELSLLQKALKSMGTFSLLDDKALSYYYGKVAQKLPLLSKMHTGIVVSGEMHRALPRELLVTTARHLGETRLLYVYSDDIATEATLEEITSFGGNESFNRRRRTEMLKIFQRPASD